MSHSEANATILQLLDDRLRQVILEVAGRIDCHLVGGAIRDWLALRQPTDDWDLIVDRRGDVIAERLASQLGGRMVRLGGERFTASRVVTGTRVVDLWDRQGAPLEQELRRRDLTINSIAVDLSTTDVVDPLGGRADIEAGILRANAPERFTEDPLRTLRLLRFSLRLPRFTIEPETLIAARSGAPQLETIAAERVRQELDRILGRPLPAAFGNQLVALGLFPGLWAGEKTTDQHAARLNDLAAAGSRLRRLIGATIEPPPVDLTAMHHALLLIAADSREPRRGLERLTSRRWIGRSTAELVARLLAPLSLPANRTDRRLFLHHHGVAWPLVATIASFAPRAGDGSHEALEALAELAAREGETILRPDPLLNGHDLERDFGVEPGPRIGALLRALGEAQAIGTIQTDRQARRWVADQLARSTGAPGAGEPGAGGQTT